MSVPSPFPPDQIQDTFDPRRSARHALALQVRELIDLMVDTEADETTLGEAEKTIRALIDRINRFGHHSPMDGFAESAVAGEEINQRFDMAGAMPVIFDRSPVMGLSNPVAPPLALRVEGDTVTGEVTFGGAYEGPPGFVHGGWIAATFDELLGMTQSLSGSGGMTGRLSITYRSPTPLRTPIRWEGRIERIDGRKIFTTGRSFVERNGEWVLTAEAEGLFISMTRERFARMAAERETERDATQP